MICSDLSANPFLMIRSTFSQNQQDWRVKYTSLPLKFFFLVALLFNFISVFGQEKGTNAKENIRNTVDKFPAGTELAIAIISNGKTEFIGYKKEQNGVTEIENRNSLFEIGSVTKVFTAALLAKEVEKGKLKLNDPISTFLPDLEVGNGKITFQQLATHTSGLPRLSPGMLQTTDFLNPYSNYSVQVLLQDLKTAMVQEAQIGHSEYSNFGTAVLGYALATFNKTTFEELLTENMLQPLKMSSTYLDRSQIKAKLVPGLDVSGRNTSGWDMNAANPAGGMISSAADLAKFMQEQINAREKWIQLMQTKQVDLNDRLAIALGWHILKGDNILWHNGATGGYRSFVAFDPASGRGIVVLSNVSAMHPQGNNLEKLGISLLKN